MWRKRRSPTNFAAGAWRRPSRPSPLTTGLRSRSRISWRARRGRCAVGFPASGKSRRQERMSFTKPRKLRARRWKAVAIALSVVGLLAAGTSCSSSGPQPPQPGTPAFYWAAARETYGAGDFIKTSENLQRILVSENDFTARARAWDTVISAGLAQGYIELADTWESGARANRADPTPFRKQVSALRSLASAAAIQFAENAHKMVGADKDPNILLAFAYPTGAAAAPAG